MSAKVSAKKTATFVAKIRQPKLAKHAEPWAYVLVPKEISEQLLRRGRIGAEVTISSMQLHKQLEPDGALGHWFRLEISELSRLGLSVGQSLQLQLSPLVPQPAPQLPASFAALLRENAQASATWDQTTILAKIDWVHWLESAKQKATQQKRELAAIDMLSQGKKRVCCFDPSGFYSRGLSAPTEAAPRAE